MNKAAQLAAKLEQLNVADGMKEIERWYTGSLNFDVINESMCIMHDDGSVNIIQSMGNGKIIPEVLSSENVIKVLSHYSPKTVSDPNPDEILRVLEQHRPYKEVFKNQIQ